MPHTTDATVLVIEDDRAQAGEYAAWLDEYDVRTATGGEAALDALDRDVDVVLLDGDLPGRSSAELLGEIRARRVGCRIGLLSGTNVGADVLRLDFDEYVPRPVGRDELTTTVERLVDRGAVEEAVETYITLVDRKRSLEARKDPDELDDDEHYRELTGEIAGRRRQITTLLTRIEDPDAEPDAVDETGPPPGPADVRESDDGDGGTGAGTPLYRTRTAGFYALWLAAALTYGVGDVVSTLYATTAVPGLLEGNPVVNTLLENFGLAGFLSLKLLVFLVLISVSVQGARSRERFSYYWPPVVMTGLGLLLTGWNVQLIVGG